MRAAQKDSKKFPLSSVGSGFRKLHDGSRKEDGWSCKPCFCEGARQQTRKPLLILGLSPNEKKYIGLSGFVGVSKTGLDAWVNGLCGRTGRGGD